MFACLMLMEQVVCLGLRGWSIARRFERIAKSWLEMEDESASRIVRKREN